MTRQHKPEDWTRTALVIALAQMAADFEYTPADLWDDDDRHQWSLFKAASISLANDGKTIHQLNEALLRSKGQ